MLKQVSLTTEEKGALRASVARAIQIAKSKPRPSMFYSGIQHGLRIGLSTFIFIIFVGGSVSVVADNSMPGDPLYPIKISFNEKVKGSMIKNPEDKISYQKTLIDNRLNEIKTLAASKTLTKAKQETAQRALDTHIQALSDQLSNAKPDEALKVTASLEQSLKTQKEDLKKYVPEGTEDSKSDVLKAVDTTIKKVSDQEVKIISKEIEKISDDINKLPDTPVADNTPATTPLPAQQSTSQPK